MKTNKDPLVQPKQKTDELDSQERLYKCKSLTDKQELAIKEEQANAAQNLISRIRNDLVNTRLAARIMIFMMSKTVFSGCASVVPPHRKE